MGMSYLYAECQIVACIFVHGRFHPVHRDVYASSQVIWAIIILLPLLSRGIANV